MATILVVDDRPENRELLVTLLGYRGHRLLQASDGAEALEVVRAERPDLVIADVLMPVMDGYELVRRLRADPALSATKVVFASAHYREAQAKNLAESCGVLAVLAKPCEPEEVLRTVDAALEAPAAPRAAPPVGEFDREHLHLLTDKLSANVEELRRTNERLTALVDLGLRLGSERDPIRLLEGFCDGAREILGARHAVVAVADVPEAEPRRVVTSGLDPAAAARARAVGRLGGVLGSALWAGRCFRAVADGPEAGVPAALPRAGAVLAAPIVSPSRVHGWVVLLGREGGGAFSEEDERLAGMLAAHVGRIYENGSLYADLLRHSARLAEEVAERRRIATDRDALLARLQVQIERMPLAYVHLDDEQRVVEWNATAERVFGWRKEEVAGRGVLELLVPPEGRAHVRDVLRRLEGGDMAADSVNENRTKDGRTIVCSWHNTPLFDAQGRASGILCLVEDVTERQALEARILDAQRRLEHVVSSAPAVLYTLRVEEGQALALSWISPNIAEMTGHSAEEARRPGWWEDRLHPEERERVLAEVAAFLADGRLAQEYRFRHRDGTFRWVRAELRLLRDEAGAPAEAVGSWTDVTERRQLEDQLRQAQKMEAVGRLAGGVAHDFNNLLTVINGYGDLVLMRLPPGDRSREPIEQIVAAGERAARLTRQLLAFSRRALVEPRVLDLRAVVADTESMLRRVLGEDIQLTTVLDEQARHVHADPGQLEQVLMNLVVNARDAMPQGGLLTVEVHGVTLDEAYARMHAEAREGPHAVLSVSDTGCGMPPETMARAFEPFFSTKGEQGTGLGLATVHGIVRQAGGHVSVYSEVGQGSVFRVYLPVVDAAPAPRAPAATPTVPEGGESILLVEDDEAVRSLATEVLRERGYAVAEARDGPEALRLAAAPGARVDLLLTDVVMPRMSGREVAARIQGLHPGARVLYLSGYTDDAVVRHGILEAEVAFLQKPFNAATLATKVRETLDR